MKILYAIQGTGNGHISRSKKIIKHLIEHAKVDILVSESQHEINLGYEIKYKLNGLGFVFGKRGGIDYLTSIKNVRLNKVIADVNDLPIDDYDIVVSDFEPISSWACKIKKKPFVSLSHQVAFLSDKTPRPEKINHLAEFIMKWYAPISEPIGLHFQKYDNFIETPIIRDEIRYTDIKNLGHYTVYLPSYDQKFLIKYLNKVDVRWELFSKHYKGSPYEEKNVTVYPISNEKFIESLSTCEGILCNSGFETPSESIFLGKKILTLPMKGQYEQECNAVSLKKMGIKILETIDKNFPDHLEEWINSSFIYKADFADNAQLIVDRILNSSNNKSRSTLNTEEPLEEFKKIKDYLEL